MSKIGRKIRLATVGSITAIVVAGYPVYAATTAVVTPALQNAETPSVIITEFQTNGGAATQEFIELYNTTDEDIVFADTDVTKPVWKIEFFNSTAVKTGAPVWTTAPSTTNSITLTGTISAHDYFLIASTDYLPASEIPDMVYSASSSHLMTDTGGGLQLMSLHADTNTNLAHDRVMWLAASSSTTLPLGVLAGPGTGKSLQREPDEDNEYVDVNGLLSEFSIVDEITPFAPWVAPVIEESVTLNTVIEGDDVTDTEVLPKTNDGLTAPNISELLPNPASPLTDADDEFIELYNPNTAAFDLSGYKLEVGTTTLHTYTLPAGTVIEPLSYKAFYSSETGLALSNSGGQARFRGPDNVVLSETMAYTTAADNQSWILNDGVWGWTTSATPGLANILAAPVAATKATKTTKAATTKKATTAKAKTTKVKAAKKTKTAAKKKTKTASAASVTVEKPKPPIHMGILVAVAGLAVLYGIYEYRHDIMHKLRKLTGNRKAGVTDRLLPAR